MKGSAENRAMEVWDVVDAVCRAFYRAYESGDEYYSVKRVFWDQTMVVHAFGDSKTYMLSWSIDEAREVSFSPENREEWQEVEETWQPVERSFSPELRALFGLEAPENAGKKPGKPALEQRAAYKAEISADGHERRTFFGEVRAKGEESEGPTKIVGYAAVFNDPAKILMRDSKGKYVEVTEEVAPGAFDGVMGDDVRALFNHDPNFILGRTNSGTLRLEVDERGLKYEIDVPDTAIGRDLLKSIQRGDISQSSFGFEIEADEWSASESGEDRRVITRVGRLYDVSPVTYPAYATTEAAARSLAAASEESAKTMSSTGYQTPEWYKYRFLAKKRV